MVRVEILILVKTSESIMDFKAINKYLVIIIIILYKIMNEKFIICVAIVCLTYIGKQSEPRLLRDWGNFKM